MQGVEPRREQAAEVVEWRRARAAEEGGAGVFGGLRFPPARISSFRRGPESSGLCKPFPQSGNDINIAGALERVLKVGAGGAHDGNIEPVFFHIPQTSVPWPASRLWT